LSVTLSTNSFQVLNGHSKQASYPFLFEEFFEMIGRRNGSWVDRLHGEFTFGSWEIEREVYNIAPTF
jgi:hypothetical protein